MPSLSYQLRALAFAIAGIAIVSCSSTPSRFELGQDSLVSINNATPESRQKGEQVILDKSSTALVEAPGKIPVMLLPQNTETAVVVNLKTSPSAPSTRPAAPTAPAAVNGQDQTDLNDILFQVNTIQVLTSKGEFKPALKKIEALEKKYPKIGLFPFLKASCFVLSGETERAKFMLIRSIAEYPQNSEGKDLYEEVKKSEGEKP